MLAISLLPLNLLSFHNLQRSNGRRPRFLQPALHTVLLISLSTILALSELEPFPTKQLSSELEEMKIQVTELELVFEEKSKILDSRIVEVDRREKMIEEMDEKIGFLQDILNDAKVSYDALSVLNENIRAMKEEVQQLWDKSRRNSFRIHVSESKILEAENKMEEIASKVEKMQNIVNEQWIQIQRLEQSLLMTKVMTSRVSKETLSDGQKRRKSNGCPMSQFRRILSRHSYSKPVELPDSFFMGGSTPIFSLLKATKEFKRIISAGQKKHHELQYMVKEVMVMNDYTATLAHRELIFLVTSTVIILPLMTAWVLLYSTFFGEPEWLNRRLVQPSLDDLLISNPMTISSLEQMGASILTQSTLSFTFQRCPQMKKRDMISLKKM